MRKHIKSMQAKAFAKDGDTSPGSWLRLDLDTSDEDSDDVDEDGEPDVEPPFFDEPDEPPNDHGSPPSPPPPSAGQAVVV